MDIQQVIKPGAQPRPERGQKVTICYTGIFNGQEFDKKDDFSFVLGEEDSLQGRSLFFFFFLFPCKEQRSLDSSLFF